MTCTKTTVTCTPIDRALKLAGLGQHNRCLTPIPPGPAGAQLTVNADGDGFCWLPSHTPVNLTNLKAPFAFSTADQCGNIPQSPTLVKNPDGTYTFDPGNGSSVTILPAIPSTFKETVTLLEDNADGSFSYTNEKGNIARIDICSTIDNYCLPMAAARQNPGTNIPGGSTLTMPVWTTLTVDTSYVDNRNGAQNGLPNGILCAETMRYDIWYQFLLTSAHPSTLLIVEAYAAGALGARFLNRWYLETMSNPTLAGAISFQGDLLSILVNAGETISLRVAWFGSTAASITSYNVRARGIFLTS